MRIRWFSPAALLGLAALAAAAGAAPAAAPAAEKAAAAGKPTLVVRLDPLETLIENFRFLAAQAGKGEEARQFEGILKARTGDQGLDGLDVKKPIGLYGTLAADLPNSEVVLLLPVADEKAFLAMLERLDLKAEEGKESVYTVNLPNVPVPGYFRFANGYAYATFRDAAAIARDRLRKPADVLPDGGTASVTLNLDTIPDSLKDLILSQMSNAVAEAKQKGKPGESDAEKAAREAGADFVADHIKGLVNEGGELSLRVDVDRKAGELSVAAGLGGKAGSKMADRIAGLPKSPGVAGALDATDAAVRVRGHFKLPDALLGPVLAAAADKGARESLEKEKDEAKRKVGESVLKAIRPTIAAGEMDGGFLLRGPDVGGRYSVTVGVRVKDGKGLEKAFREAWEKSSAEERAKVKLKLDFAKAGDVNVHRVEPDKVDDKTRALLGDGPVFVAIRDDAVFFTGGAGAEAAIKSAVATGPKPGPLLDAEVSFARLARLMAAENPAAPEAAKEAFAKNPEGDRMRLTLEGGKALRLRLSMKTALLGFFAKLEEQKGKPAKSVQ